MYGRPMASSPEPHGSHGGRAIRLIASNGEPVRVDEQTGEVVARQSPGREWDTWQIQSAGDDQDGRVYLIAPSGNAVTVSGEQGSLRATAPLAQADGIDIVPLSHHGDGDGHGHGNGHGNGDGHGAEDDHAIADPVAPAVALRTAAGDCV